MLTIRLQRIGKKKFPAYRLIISEKGRDTHDRYLENLGTYNPRETENKLQCQAERVTYWIGKGAQMSATVNNLLVKAGVITGQKMRSVFLNKKRKAKITEKKSANEKAMADKKSALAAEASVAKEAEETAPASETPAVETAPEVPPVA